MWSLFLVGATLTKALSGSGSSVVGRKSGYFTLVRCWKRRPKRESARGWAGSLKGFWDSSQTGVEYRHFECRSDRILQEGGGYLGADIFRLTGFLRNSSLLHVLFQPQKTRGLRQSRRSSYTRHHSHHHSGQSWIYVYVRYPTAPLLALSPLPYR